MCTCSDSKEAARQLNQGSHLWEPAFLFLREDNLKKKKNKYNQTGLYVIHPRPKGEQWKQQKQEQREQTATLFGLTSNLSYGSGVQSFLLQKPQQIRGKRDNPDREAWLWHAGFYFSPLNDFLMSETVRERNGQDRNLRPVWELRPYYWPPPWGVPVVLRSPRGCAAPSSAPLNRACRCWAESGCLLALLPTEDIKEEETGVRLEHSRSKVTQPNE